MFEYKFHKITGRRGIFSYSYDYSYQQIIQSESQLGWRFIQLVPTLWDSHGRAKEMDLIFERPKDWEQENAKYAEKIV